ncbi:hypothetical protein ACJJIL_20450 [Microbulbifer sp. EKSA005]|uniref:hypothetical protein n=1 Tax=Microbulbifer sp. EKSA005 TaxID=3243364 RepID=UPI0040413164
MVKVREIISNLFNGHAIRNHIENIVHSDTGAFDARFAAPYLGIDYNIAVYVLAGSYITGGIFHGASPQVLPKNNRGLRDVAT